MATHAKLQLKCITVLIFHVGLKKKIYYNENDINIVVKREHELHIAPNLHHYIEKLS
jgi:hypothetical protein